MYTLSEKAIIYLDNISNLEYKHKRAILDLYDNASELFENKSLFIDYLKSNLGNKFKDFTLESIDESKVEAICDKYAKLGIELITEVSDLYPKNLKETAINPICLYAMGKTSLLSEENLFSIVGSRKTLPQYLKLTEDFSNNLVSKGIILVTGVAVGVDLSVIKGAYKSGKIILVLAGGLDYINSEVNRDYINLVLSSGGLVISEYPLGVPQLSYHYPIRNRIIAGLSKGTLIVSGSLKSGARHTASFALDYGREVFAFPYTIGALGGELCNSLIKDGAYLTSSVEDIYEILKIEGSSNAPINLTETEKLVLNAIKNGKTLFDDLLSATNLKIYELMPILMTLEIKGCIVKVGGNEYSVIKK